MQLLAHYPLWSLRKGLLNNGENGKTLSGASATAHMLIVNVGAGVPRQQVTSTVPTWRRIL